MTEKEVGEAKVVADLTRESVNRPRLKTIDAADLGQDVVPFAMVPDGTKLMSVKALLDEWLDRPRKREGIAKLQTLHAFCEHVNRNKLDESAVFADRYSPTPSLVAVYDYMGPSTFEGELLPDGGKHSFCRHRAKYEFPLSPEWTKWKSMSGDLLEQEAFAEFIEERIVDVIDPIVAQESTKEYAKLLGMSVASPSRMVELSRGLSIHSSNRFQKAVNLASGESALVFATQHQDSSGELLKIPGLFLIAIPVFRAGDRFQVMARLRFRAGSGTVKWTYELTHLDDIFDVAFEEACAIVRERTELPLFMGTPET